MKNCLNAVYGVGGRCKKPTEMKDAKIHRIEAGDNTISNAFRTFVNEGKWLSADEVYRITNSPNSLNKTMTPDYLRDAICDWLDTSSSIEKGDGIIYIPGHEHTLAYAEFNPNKSGILSPICHDYNLMARNGSMMAEANKWNIGLDHAKKNQGERIILLHLYSNRGYNEDKETMTLVTYTCTYGDILKHYEDHISFLEKKAAWLVFVKDFGITPKETGYLHVARGIMKGTIELSEQSIYDALCIMRGTDKMIPGDISAKERARDIMFEFNKYPNSKKPTIIVADQYLNRYYLSSNLDDDRADASLFLRDVISSKSGHGTKSDYVIFRKQKKSKLVEATIIRTGQFDDYADNLEMVEISNLLIDFIGKNVGKGFEINV